MYEASAWRLALGRQVATAYAQQPNAEVVMIAGSTGRGRADRYSDLEIDVYYGRPPTVQERKHAVTAAGGTLVGLDADDDEWEEQMSFDGFAVTSSTFLSSTMNRYLAQVVDRGEIAPAAQTRISSLLHARCVKGHDRAGSWRDRASAYPDALANAMLAEYLPVTGFGATERMLAARDDQLALYRRLVDAERMIIGALLGINRTYMPTPTHDKGIGELVAAMEHKPADLAARLKWAFHAEPREGVAVVRAIIDDVVTLVAAHVPTFDLNPYRGKDSSRSRIAWDTPPSGLRS